jgi:ABC-type polysaccharide/polyol phosphate export permease
MVYIYGVIISLWTYLTPIMYDISIIPVQYQTLFKLNPMYWYIDFARQIILHNQIPSLMNWAMCLGSSVIFLVMGTLIFKSKQDKFIYYL